MCRGYPFHRHDISPSVGPSERDSERGVVIDLCPGLSLEQYVAHEERVSVTIAAKHVTLETISFFCN
jgi:hypothetical protein